jgi:glyoxylase-like metal-dependent hydrolase (beta-lactamase superfamily II)
VNILKSILAAGLVTALAVTAAAQTPNAALAAAETTLGTGALTSLKVTGTGSSAMIGQGLAAGVSAKWVLNNYVAEFNYADPGLRMTLDRAMLDGSAPFGGARQIWVLSDGVGWNVGANGMPQALNPRPDTQLSSLQERQLQVWLSTPQGFIKAARANRATARAQGQGATVTFTAAGGVRVTGVLNRANQVERVEAVLDNSVLGDMIVETTFRDYKAFGGLQFPQRIIQRHGGLTTLDLTVSAVEPNAVLAVEVPVTMRTAPPPALRVDVQPLAPGVWTMAGGSHHSVLIEFADHLVLVDGPLGDARVNAVVAEAVRLVPNKPIRYLVQTHHHFDHQGGFRAAAAEVQTILTGASSREYWESVLQRPRTAADKLAQRAVKPTVEGVSLKRVLSDATRTVELHAVPFNGHVDEMLYVYLPAEKIVIQVDGQAPGIVAQIDRLKLDVATHVPLHGNRQTIAELRAAAARPAN